MEGEGKQLSTADNRTLLLRSLLSRLDADAESERPRHRSVVSDAEREALRALLDQLSQGGIAEPDGPDPGDAGSPGGPTPEPVQPPVEYRIDPGVLELNAPPVADWVLCIDFGTAMSKAFACRTTDGESALDELELDDLELLELPLGDADRRAGVADPAGYGADDSVYAVVSSVWIDDSGLMYAGTGALERGRLHEHADVPRERLDSIKQQISQIATAHYLDSPSLAPERRPLTRKVNPTSVELTYEDAITFYLSYLTDLAVTQLEEKIGFRYVKRRFTLPWWEDERQRRWGAALMARVLARAQIAADTFHGRWKEGIPVSEVKAVLKLAAGHDDRLTWLLDRSGGENRQDGNDRVDALATMGGGLEALAAASGRVWTDKPDCELMLVVDVGAGTTDLSLFWVVQDGRKRRAFPVAPGGAAIRQAGDSLDSRLLEQLLNRAHIGEDPALRERMGAGLRLKGVRRMKETLFRVGVVDEILENDEPVKLTREGFLASEAVKGFENAICRKIEELLGAVDESFFSVVDRRDLTLVLTGGGCDLPMIRGLKDRRWSIGGKAVKCCLAKDVPDFVKERFGAEFAGEYPQLAVAMGGAMPWRLDERRMLRVFAGGARDPGPLEKFPTEGV